MKIKILNYSVILILFFGSFGLASAQVKDYDISASVNPEVPGPNQDVTVSLSSFATDLNKADISWTLNGTFAIAGTGQKSFSFKTGDNGQTSTVDASVSIPGLPSVSKRIIIQPGDVDLLWQAVDSYVPPFYQGKALPSSEAEIKVVAIPNIRTPDGVKLTDKDFSYTWTRNLDVDQGSSGYNKNAFSFKNSYLEGVEDISVAATSVLGNYAAEGKTEITPGSPKIVFYESLPGIGEKYNQAIADGYAINKSVMKVVAEPYFFSGAPTSDDLDYKWSINGDSAPTPSTKNALVLQTSSETAGQANISLLVSSLSSLFQTASLSKVFNILQ